MTHVVLQDRGVVGTYFATHALMELSGKATEAEYKISGTWGQSHDEQIQASCKLNCSQENAQLNDIKLHHPVVYPVIPTGEKPSGNLPSEVRVAIESMKKPAIITVPQKHGSFIDLLPYPLERARQRDTISPKLSAALQWIMKSLDWDHESIRFDEKSLSMFCFAVTLSYFRIAPPEQRPCSRYLTKRRRRPDYA
ncbi:hypothetical protein KIN20_036916 [Parelaphostrongylus tenuis]|uniref:Uncharacterized protein n=1 Tax=Parelaphostrongylus tenuis TaxID=148309 RepID=A0AAD5RH50_PARTN|nr:hypothetical protein KIN20_036916 [Parelaphostrongylus tenuis]